MTEQHKYYTLTEDVKTLIQYIQEQAIDHSVVKAANRLNWAIKNEDLFKHPTINIGGVELPMPETIVLARDTKYWVFPYPAHRELFRSLQWSCAPSDIDALQAGQVHLTEERAKAWADWWKKEVITKINETVS